jgi:hypothetical protein
MGHDQGPNEEHGRELVPEPHEPPRLIELGSYAELTRGHTGTNPDGIEASTS